MNYYPDIHPRSASEEVIIRPHEFAPISHALNYVARAAMASSTAVDVESTYLSLNCTSEPEGLFDGVGVSQGMDLTSQQLIDGDATLSLSVYGQNPHEIRTFLSLPEGSSSTATTTFIELVGQEQDLTHTYNPEHIAILLDQTLGTSTEALFSQVARQTADMPFQEFVSGVMKRASRFAKAKRIEQQYRGDALDISSREMPVIAHETTENRSSRLPKSLDYLQQTEATLTIIRSPRKTPNIRNTLSAPVVISGHVPASSYPFSYGDNLTTLRETFGVTTPLIDPKNLRALIRPIINAKLQIEHTGGMPLGRPNDLYKYAKNAAERVEPVQYVHRSLQILNDHKELGLVDFH